MSVVTPKQRDDWRKDAERDAEETRHPSGYYPSARILALLDTLDAPCGSCHPCTQWANQTWVNAGERLPHVHEWQEMKAQVARVEALTEGPASDGVRPYAADLLGDGEVTFVVKLDDLRAALAGDPS